MKLNRLFFAFLCAIAFPFFFFAEEPWEAVACADPRFAFNSEPRLRADPFRAALDASVEAYRATQSEQSVHRCMFLTSCSAFLYKAADTYGLPLGMLAFADRYLYRENAAAFALYPLRGRPDGVYKLDDDYYLAP